MARVEGGSVRVGWPGAPGWTTTGAAGSACWAETDSDNKHARAPAAQSRGLESNHFIAFDFCLPMVGDSYEKTTTETQRRNQIRALLCVHLITKRSVS